MTRDDQDIYRLILAFVAAWVTSAVATTALLATDALMARGSLWPDAAFVAGGALILISTPAMLTVGLPAFLLLRNYVRRLPGRSAAAGGLAGAVFMGGWITMAIPNHRGALPLEFLVIIAQAAAVGAASGFAFWFVAYSSYGPWGDRWRREP
ncbi:MAG: hypothetical protein IT546_08320 [Caulobacteraceae bacterium]|nr:hypothetical protein [Caulobacteraceae bacterium]